VKNVDDFIKLYYEGLSDLLRQLGNDLDKMFLFDDLGNQSKMWGRFELRIMVTMIKNLFVRSGRHALGEVFLKLVSRSKLPKSVATEFQIWK
jgi:hypothetical protein